LDLKRVLQADECSAALLSKTAAMLNQQQKILLLTHCPEHFGNSGETINHERFADIDCALEWCEDQLLQQEQPEWLRGGRQISLPAMDILQGFDPSEIALIETILLEKRYHAGEIIVREGDSADSLYLLASGRVSICLSLRDRARRQRLSTISPGVAFGELALLDGGKRSADAIADEPALCYVLPIDKLQELAKHHPNIESKLIFNIGRELSARLRRADAEIRALAD